MMNLFKKYFGVIGPGVITGAADDDPSGIATYSQTGAQFGYGQLWTALFMLPMLVVIQETCARIGAVTGTGIAGVVKKHYSKKILYPLVFLMLGANVINIGVDIGAMAAAANLIIPLNFIMLTVLFSFIILIMEIFLSYKTYAKYLKWLCLFLFAYPISVFIVQAPMGTVLKATFIPHLEFNFQFLFIITAVFGTTISPYLFFWQTSQVVEEKHLKQGKEKHVSRKFIKKLQVDNAFGMLFSEIVTWSIIVVTATTLHAHGITDIKTAADAAKALEPFVQSFPNSGYIAKVIFAMGVIGLGFLAVPVLAGSAAYAMGETFDWEVGIDKKFKQAKAFYIVIILSTLIGLLINFIGVDPIKALVYAAVINGIVAVPLIFIIALIGKNEKIMQKNKSGMLSTNLVIATFLGMLGSTIALFLTFFMK